MTSIILKEVITSDYLQRRDSCQMLLTRCARCFQKVVMMIGDTEYMINLFVFAAVAVCRYQRYGRGGGQETKGALCVLSLNMINDKVAILLSSYSP